MKKKIVSVMLVMMMLSGCGKVATPVEELPGMEQLSGQQSNEMTSEAAKDDNAEISLEESKTSTYEVFEDEAWNKVFGYTSEKINSLIDQVTVTYEPYPAPYPFVNHNSGSENGGYRPNDVKYEEGKLIINEEELYGEGYHFRLTLSDYEKDCFNNLTVSKIYSDGTPEEIIETHNNDAFMQEFRSIVLKNQEEAEYERENTRSRTDVEKYDACAEFGLSAIKEENVGDYDVISYSNELYGNKTVYMEIKMNGHIVATIRDNKVLNDYDDEEHVIRFYNYEGSIIYESYYEKYLEDNDWDSIYEYDKYGNFISFEDICGGWSTGYDFADKELTYIINQCNEILNANNEYRRNWN